MTRRREDVSKFQKKSYDPDPLHERQRTEKGDRGLGVVSRSTIREPRNENITKDTIVKNETKNKMKRKRVV